MTTLMFIVVAGFVAGAMNAAAGGGSFVSLPALVWVGVPALAANISSTIALWPAGLASAWAFREDFRPFNEVSLPALTIASLLGGGVGALLLLLTPQSAFDAVIPWLLLVATLTFAFGHRLGPALRQRLRIGPVTLILVQFVLAVYGGYFGGAVGIMMMAAWTLLSGSDLHRMNPVRTVLVSATNGVAVLCFLVAAQVWWGHTAAMLAGATAGGYVGARVVRRLDTRWLRFAVIALTAVITMLFFVRAMGE